MERASICSICNRVAKPAYTCQLCGAIACRDDFDMDKNICKRCVAGRRYVDGSTR